jgi:Spy/CpxP family protein refolding chaperone
MTRRLDMHEAQVRAIMRAAKREGVRVEVKIGAAVVTVLPEDPSDDDKAVAQRKEIRL